MTEEDILALKQLNSDLSDLDETALRLAREGFVYAYMLAKRPGTL